MKITAGMVKSGHWREFGVSFGDGYSLIIGYLKRERRYMAILRTPDGENLYGWHQIPRSCLAIPTMCDCWKRVVKAVDQHAKMHGGLAELSDTV